MKKIYYSLTIALSIIVIVSCSTESTPVYQLFTSIEPVKAGTVNPCSGEFDEGNQIEITATPNENWIFDRWSGGHTGNTNPASVTMNSDKDITALFVKKEYPLTVNTEGEGTVSERVIRAKTTDYPHGTKVQLTANASDGWEFVEWQGDLKGDLNPSNVTVEEEMSITAVFQETSYSIDVFIGGEGNIIIDPIKETYEFGDIVTFTVEPVEGWSFVHWEGSLDGDQNPYVVSMSQNLSISAILDENPFAGGNGSEMYPYQVSTVEQLQLIRNYTEKNFVQINNIDATETASWNAGQGFKPIGDISVKFTGSYSGGNFSILNLKIDKGSQEDQIALFGVIESGYIKGVNLKNIIVIGGVQVAGLVALNFNSQIENSTVSGQITGRGSVGGLVGYCGRKNGINCSISNSSADVNVTGFSRVGGLVGHVSYGQIDNSSSSGEVQSTGWFGTGGLVGELYFNEGSVSNSYSEANVYSTREKVGGLIGSNGGEVKKSYSLGSIVSETSSVGGLIGSNVGRVVNSYSFSDVKGKNEIGGLIGTNFSNGVLITSYSASAVTGEEDFGGLVGVNGAIIESSYWDTESTEQADGIGRGNSAGTTGLTTFEMQGSAAENMPEFDWNEIWTTTEGYPKLRWQDD